MKSTLRLANSVSWTALFLAATLFTSSKGAHAQTHPDLPKWEVGAGVGYIRFEQYPASEEYTNLTLPFPTFTYRGDILRADDRKGAKLLFYRWDDWILQVGGFAVPPLPSHRNQARRGMSDLPLLAGVGPELQKVLTNTLTCKIGLYPAMAFTFEKATPRGGEWEADLTYRDVFSLKGRRLLGFDSTATFLSWKIIGASQEVHDLFYGVGGDDVTAARPAYRAKAGVLQTHLTFLQSFTNDHFGFYVGGRWVDHRLSPSTDSPLYKSDFNLSVLVGVTYSFYQSRGEGVSDRDASGAVKKIRDEMKRKRQD